MKLNKKKFYIVYLFLLIQSVHGTDREPDPKINERKGYSSSKLSAANNRVTRNEEMQKIDIVRYVTGAYCGALVGSFFVHIFDTIAAKKFMKEEFEWSRFTKHTLKSYLPVALWVVPARSISFGVYGFFQNIFSDMYLELHCSKVFSAMLSGCCLSLLSTPAEILKTRGQLGQKPKSLTFYEIRKNFLPLSLRVVPTVTCMLSGTDFIRSILPMENIVISTSCASILAATISHVFATPSENLRIYRIHHQDYASKTTQIISKMPFKNLYAGFWSRSLSLGIQAAFTLSAANSASSSKGVTT